MEVEERKQTVKKLEAVVEWIEWSIRLAKEHKQNMDSVQQLIDWYLPTYREKIKDLDAESMKQVEYSNQFIESSNVVMQKLNEYSVKVKNVSK